VRTTSRQRALLIRPSTSDLRPPKIARLKGVIWNRSNQQLLVPTAFGVGWTVNLAALRTRLAR